ncbi:hypothetical protein FACS189498_2020 [Spirochaetia bacterium]|nr:hypothetical protein FACS189498_2020 [Spirochaetia bacterium]
MIKVLFRRIAPLVIPVFLILASCATLKEDTYLNKTYNELVKEKGEPSYTLLQVIDKNYDRSKFEPNFFLYFTDAELEASVTVRYAVWRKTGSTLTAWFREMDDDWIVFSCEEHTGAFIK